MKNHFLQRLRLTESNKLFYLSETLCLIFISFIPILCSSCKDSREIEMEKREQFLEQMFLKNIYNPSLRFISIFGCNIGDSYDSLKNTLIEKGFENTSSSFDGHQWTHQWKGQLSGKEFGMQIDCCGKYIIRIWMYIGCKSEEDLHSTYMNVLQSLNKKYGSYSREDDVNIWWDRDIVRINLYCTDLSPLVKSRNIVGIVYDNLPYKNWLKEYDASIKRNETNNEKKVFDDNL